MAGKVLQFMKLAEAGDNALHNRYNTCQFYEVADQDRWLREHGAGVHAIVTSGHLGVTSQIIEQLPALGIIAIAGVGYEHVDLDLARRRGIRVTNTPDVLTHDVADAAIGLMISAMRAFQAAGRYIQTGDWKTRGDMGLASKASGRRYGLFGLGRIGMAVANRLAPFGGSIGYASRTRKDVPYRQYPSVLELAEHSDVLFVTVPARPETTKKIDRAVLDALGPQGFLINVARGAIVDEQELVSALVDGRLGGAGLDVFVDEPNVPEALFDLPNVAITPHIASATVDTREAMAQLMLSNLDAFFAGRPLPAPVI